MFGFDKRILYVMLAIFVISGIVDYMSDPDALLALVLTLPGVLLAITFHEFAHAFAADKLGDDTPRRQGRLNLNPLSHLDPIGTVLLVFAHFGWGKPVGINPRNFDRKVTMQQGEAIVSIAGPLMNFILAIILAIILTLIMNINSAFFITQIGNIVYLLLFYALIVNIGLGVFNLLPLPPLDGSKIFMNILPYKARYWLIEHEQILYIVFLVIWITGLAGKIISPIIDIVYQGIVGGAGWLIGLFF